MASSRIYDDVSEWYSSKRLGARRLDVLGGSLGSDFYLLEGDSIIQRVLDDEVLNLNFEDGSFQLLHIRYILEKLLLSFKRRSENFAVVFFDANKYLSTLAGVSSPPEYASRYFLREVLKAHIQTLGLQVLSFPDVRSESWLGFVNQKMPALICASVNDYVHGKKYSPEQQLKARDLHYLQMTTLWAFSGAELPVAALNTLEFEESRSITYFFKAARKREPSDRLITNTPQKVMDNQLLFSTRNALLESLAQQLPASTAVASQDSISWQIQGIASYLKTPQGEDPLNRALLYAWIAHLHLLSRLSPSDRSLPYPALDKSLVARVVTVFYPSLFPLLAGSLNGASLSVDIDGNIFGYVLDAILGGATVVDLLGVTVTKEVDNIWAAASAGAPELAVLSSSFKQGPKQSSPPARPSPKLLAFHHEVLDQYTGTVQVATEHASSSASSRSTTSILLDPLAGVSAKTAAPAHRALARAPPPVNERARLKKLKRDQRQMAFLTRQAGSLTGAAGAVLQQQVIVAEPPSTSKSKGAQAAHASASAQKAKAKDGKTKGGKAAPVSKADQIRQANAKQKATQADASADTWWRSQLEELKKLPVIRQQTALELLFRSPKAQEDWLKAEMSLYKVDLIVRTWIDDPKAADPAEADQYRVRIVSNIKDISRMPGCTPGIRKTLTGLLRTLGLGEIELPVPRNGDAAERAALFSFTKTWSKSKERALQPYFPITETPIEFQLRAFGEYMDRSMDSRPDHRTSFDPDAWQAQVLDKIDERSSMLVVAPTSAGKTFIGFYAMERILRESDDGILVYIAPTKALVTQVAAEVYARFKKDRKGGSCWAVHTREVQLNNALETQILVTIPEVLFDLYTNPALAKSWLPRLRFVIFDEIHSIAEERGTIWTQLILMTQCPVIGLSATVGDAAGFSKWLGDIQEAHGHKHALIVHPHRYSHLRKFVWAGQNAKPPPLRFIHPMAPLELGPAELPGDLALESRDCVTLYQALVTAAESKGDKSQFADLEPNTFFKSQATSFLRQKDVLAYEAALKERLQSLVRSNEQVERGLGHDVISTLAKGVVRATPESNPRTDFHLDKFETGKELVSMLKVLDEQGDLPAILFTFSRNKMDDMAKQLLESLVEAEDHYRATSPKWKQNLQEWDKWVKIQEKAARDATKGGGKRKAAGGGSRDEDGGKRKDEEKGTGGNDEVLKAIPPGLTNPDEPSPEFSYGSFKKYTRSELDEDIQELSWSSRLAPWQVDCLKRGIAMHHAGMPKGYRSLIETLFRIGYIRVMFSTETLALGINAPARTAVFVGDSKFLSPLLYRQCAGRAGRRGFDLLGKVMFIGVPLAKICRLQLAKLPPMTGKYPITATLMVQALRLLQGSNNEPAAKAAVKGLFSAPRATVDTPVGSQETTCLLRFNLDFLRRLKLIDEDGTPLTLSPIATALHEDQPGNLALVALIGGGFFHTLCKDFDKQKITVTRTIVLVLSHLFARRPILRFSKEALAEELKRSPSEVILPRLPKAAREILDTYNQLVLNTYSGFALTYATQYEDDLPDDAIWPLGGDADVEEEDGIPIIEALQRRAIESSTRSVFVSNSGYGDNYNSVEELCSTSRPGINLEKFMTPYIELPDDKTPWVLNAAIYDFFVHGSQHELFKANRVGRGTIWYLLNDFFLILEAFQTALEQIFKNSIRAGGGADDITAREHADLDDEKEDVQDLFGENAEGGVSAAFPTKPAELPTADWDVYRAVVAVRVEFETKFKAMWA